MHALSSEGRPAGNGDLRGRCFLGLGWFRGKGAIFSRAGGVFTLPRLFRDCNAVKRTLVTFRLVRVLRCFQSCFRFRSFSFFLNVASRFRIA